MSSWWMQSRAGSVSGAHKSARVDMMRNARGIIIRRKMKKSILMRKATMSEDQSESERKRSREKGGDLGDVEWT